MILYSAYATLPLHTSDGIDDCVDWTLLVPQNRMQPYYNWKQKQSNIINSITPVSRIDATFVNQGVKFSNIIKILPIHLNMC